MRPIPERHRTNGWNYKLVERNQRAAIYTQSKHPDLPAGGKAAAWEVFAIRRSPAKKWGEVEFEACERLPGDEDFGRTAWSCPTEARARVKFVELTAKS